MGSFGCCLVVVATVIEAESAIGSHRRYADRAGVEIVTERSMTLPHMHLCIEAVIGGLGEAVAAVLLSHGVTPAFRQIGLPDAFLDAGALPTLHDRYGISTQAMADTVKTWLR